MDITIQDERRFSFRSEYDISGGGVEYYARKAFFSFHDKIRLQASDGHILARIRGYFSPLRLKHDFYLSDGRVFHFRCAKLWTRVFECGDGKDCYQLYQHKGLKYSIFREDRQIAAFRKNRLVIGKGNKYELRVDSDADLPIVLCLVLTYNVSEEDDKHEAVTVDFGNIGPEDRPFDSMWEPR